MNKAIEGLKKMDNNTLLLLHELIHEIMKERGI